MESWVWHQNCQAFMAGDLAMVIIFVRLYAALQNHLTHDRFESVVRVPGKCIKRIKQRLKRLAWAPDLIVIESLPAVLEPLCWHEIDQFLSGC
ncbi:hypothetical protein NPIL_443431 [Nephila pilipes]|uniref:Uncharacterized protein n=1 Tax=Nephila pilipes TaxID=299642 RepID=A0A8X6TCN2_NEPPI|nr:hypothetical protein NPIL_443431 [Nephila pilipes]